MSGLSPQQLVVAKQARSSCPLLASDSGPQTSWSEMRPRAYPWVPGRAGSALAAQSVQIGRGRVALGGNRNDYAGGPVTHSLGAEATLQRGVSP